MTLGGALTGVALATAGTALILAVANYEPQPDPQHGWWRQSCVRSHSEYSVTTTPVIGTNGSVSIAIIPTTVEVCDRHSWYCPDNRECPASIKPDEPGPSTNEP